MDYKTNWVKIGFFSVKYRSLSPAVSLRNLLITANYIQKKIQQDPTKQIPLKSRTVWEKNPALCGRRGTFTPSLVRLVGEQCRHCGRAASGCFSFNALRSRYQLNQWIIVFHTCLSVPYTSSGLINTSSKIFAWLMEERHNWPSHKPHL